MRRHTPHAHSTRSGSIPIGERNSSVCVECPHIHRCRRRLRRSLLVTPTARPPRRCTFISCGATGLLDPFEYAVRGPFWYAIPQPESTTRFLSSRCSTTHGATWESRTVRNRRNARLADHRIARTLGPRKLLAFRERAHSDRNLPGGATSHVRISTDHHQASSRDTDEKNVVFVGHMMYDFFRGFYDYQKKLECAFPSSDTLRASDGRGEFRGCAGRRGRWLRNRLIKLILRELMAETDGRCF